MIESSVAIPLPHNVEQGWVDLCLSLGEMMVWRGVRHIRVGGQQDLQVTPSLGQLDLSF